MALDLDQLRALDEPGRDAALRTWLEPDPVMREQIADAYRHWHVPFRNRILAEFEREIPGITQDDVESLLASYHRVYGGK